MFTGACNTQEKLQKLFKYVNFPLLSIMYQKLFSK